MSIALRILVCDDDPVIGRAILRTLAALGHQVSLVTDPNVVVDRARRSTLATDVLVVDVMMNDTDGPALARDVMRHGAIGVVFVSGFDPDSLRDRGIDTDAWPFVQKPFSRAALEAAVVEAWARRKASAVVGA